MKDGLDKATRYLDEAYSIAHKRYPLLEAQIVNQQSVIAFRNKNYEQAKTLMMQALSLCELAEGKHQTIMRFYCPIPLTYTKCSDNMTKLSLWDKIF